MSTHTIIPFEATHPGTLIKDELDMRDDITQKDLAMLLGVQPSFLNEIIKGKRPVTADIALLLEKTLGISADYWMKFQSQYEIDHAKLKEKNINKIKLIELWNIITQYVPVKYFNKRGYLTDDIASNIQSIQAIYHVHSIDGLVQKFSERKFAFFRKSEKLNVDEKNIIAWVSLAEYEAERKETNTFKYENLPQLNIELQKIFYHNKDVINAVDKKLAQYGIKFLLIDALEKTPIDGYSFWSKKNPVIATTMRHQRMDNFAFTILHELGHIALHLKNHRDMSFMDLTDRVVNDIEKEANQYAQESLIPPSIWDELLENELPFTDEVIMKYSKKYKINPAIIFGRYCYEMKNYRVRSGVDRSVG